MSQDDRKALIVSYAAIHGDEPTSQQFKVSVRSIQRYRREAGESDTLSQSVAHKKDLVIAKWTEGAPSAVTACVAFVARAARDGDHRDPQMVHAIAGAIKILSEAMANREVLDVWIDDVEHSRVARDSERIVSSKAVSEAASFN